MKVRINTRFMQIDLTKSEIREKFKLVNVELTILDILNVSNAGYHRVYIHHIVHNDACVKCPCHYGGKKWAYWNHAQRILLNDISWQWNLRQSVMRRHTPEVYSTAIQQGFWLSLNVHKLTCFEKSRHLMSSTVEYLNVLLFVLLLFVCFVTILHCGSHATKHAYKGTVWQCKKRSITSNKKASKVYRNHDSVWYN